MPKLMILGAGIYQVPLIMKAQEMGLETLVVSCPGPYPGLEVADRALPIDTTDSEAVLDAARRERIDGITTTGTDVAVRTIGVVCDELGLPGVSESCAASLTDKADMKAMFVRGGVPTSPFERVLSLEGARSAAKRLGYPVMVKACDVSGSRGVTRVDDECALKEAYAAAVRVSRADHMVVEGYVEGAEIGIDGFVVDGELALFAPHDKFTHHAGGVTIPAGHVFPSTLPADVTARAETAVRRAVSASGMTTGALNVDAMVTPEGDVSILEMGARCGATGIPELITMHTGIDYYAQIVRASLGLPTDLTMRDDPVPCMSKLLLSNRSLVVTEIDRNRLEKVSRRRRARVTLDVTSGDRVRAARDGTDRFGSVVMPTSSASELDEALGEILSCITFENPAET